MKNISSKVTNAIICLCAAALYGFVLGFSYGNTFRYDGFNLKDWQPLTGAMVAIAVGLLAYLGVRGSQRITVMLKEEERIDRELPGLKQTSDLFGLMLKHIKPLERPLLYLVRELIRGIVRPQDTETFETISKRMLPLADPELLRSATAIIFRIMTQADMLTVMKDEFNRTQRDIAAIHTFHPGDHDKVREVARRTQEHGEREVETFLSIVKSAEDFRNSLDDRIALAEERRSVIRKVVRNYFNHW